MLAAKYRLHKNFQFRYVYTHGKTVASGPLVLVVCKAKKQNVRIGFSVSNKIGKAAFRNRIKRLLREAARELLPAIQLGHNLIVAASNRYPFTRETGYGELYAVLKTLLGNAGLITVR